MDRRPAGDPNHDLIHLPHMASGSIHLPNMAGGAADASVRARVLRRPARTRGDRGAAASCRALGASLGAGAIMTSSYLHNESASGRALGAALGAGAIIM